MAGTQYERRDGDHFVTEIIETDSQTAEVYGHICYRMIRVSATDGSVSNNGTDTEKIIVETVNGLEVARGTDPENATVLDYDGDLMLSVDGQKMTKTVTNGSLEFDLTTDKSAGSEIEIVAESLATHPAESDRATIEVVSA